MSVKNEELIFIVSAAEFSLQAEDYSLHPSQSSWKLKIADKVD